jgi:DNA-binding transcriptional ArsR family regulator
MTGGSGDGPVPLRYIEDVETMRVLADPLRLAILRVLMTDAEFRPPVMSAKELAAALDEPQTKLYRHLKQLEDVGLIVVAETRLVSGIVEQRYRAGQISITMSRELITDPAAQSDLMRTIAVAIDDFRDELLAHWSAGRITFTPDAAPGESLGMIIQASMFGRMGRAKAADFRARLNALTEEFLSLPDEPDGVPVRLMIGWYATEGEPTAPPEAG